MKLERNMVEFEALPQAERERQLHEAAVDIVARMSEATRADVEAALAKSSPETLAFWRKLVREGDRFDRSEAQDRPPWSASKV
jgi:hypothetical protein